ncbi:MAG: winged-helix domain-containing protein [bacterium]
MKRIADSTVRRLSIYLRFLEEFEGRGVGTVSSASSSTTAGPDRCPR